MIDLFDLGVIAFIFWLVSYLNNRDQKKIEKKLREKEAKACSL